MPTILTRTAVAAAGVAYPLVGSQFEYLPYNARLAFAVVGEDTTPGALTATIYSGSDVLMQNSPITEKPVADLRVDAQADFLVQDVAAGGERISVELRNSDVAARTAIVCVTIFPV